MVTVFSVLSRSLLLEAGPPPTITQKMRPVFGNIAKNEGNRQKVADNVISFIKEDGFDGIDTDCGGNKDDTRNIVALMKTLKDTFDKVAKGNYALTFTVPASYWYIRWFDLPGMLKYTDWVKVMSYDLHGTSCSAHNGGYQY